MINRLRLHKEEEVQTVNAPDPVGKGYLSKDALRYGSQ